ncbi:hypothetical protein M404DRAFT_1008505 [Pisolithus tinctorius Marx 270]|uniref:Uncharacterized protein n=1 Tax=Pisolithus tinctorius Marx 270 TaxID=870435 RepID=A0A0C3IAV0_PISTI|nr:hypothetical protein M404DRAFT_1008505 [Pisolithus tinctorius Marx 270]
MDGWWAWVDECSDQRIALGDYGDYFNGTFLCTGNIYEDMRTLGIDTMDSAYCPVVSRKYDHERPMKNGDDLTVAHHDKGKHLALHQSKGVSVPANERFVLLLKALSTRAAGKHLVIMVIEFSDFYRVDNNGERRDSGGSLRQWEPLQKTTDFDSTICRRKPLSLAKRTAVSTEKGAIPKYSKTLLCPHESA